MAGSYMHVVGDDGALLENDEQLCSMLETTSGDVVECVTEMYGMIWAMAAVLEEEGWHDGATHPQRDTAGWVEWARQNYKVGLALSPSNRTH